MWTYSRAYFYGSKADPQPGHFVVIELVDESDSSNPQYNHQVWTFEGTQTKAQFVNMVRGEVKAMLRHLNSSLPQGEASDEFAPTG